MEFVNDNWDKILVIVFAGMSVLFAGFSFLVLFLDYKRNSANVIVKMERGIANIGGKTVNIAACSVVNKGRRPINISSFKFLLEDGQAVYFIPGISKAFLTRCPVLPVLLDETHVLDFSMYLDDLAEAFAEGGAKPKALSFYDSVGNSHEFKIEKKVWSEFFE